MFCDALKRIKDVKSFWIIINNCLKRALDIFKEMAENYFCFVLSYFYLSKMLKGVERVKLVWWKNIDIPSYFHRLPSFSILQIWILNKAMKGGFLRYANSIWGRENYVPRGIYEAIMKFWVAHLNWKSSWMVMKIVRMICTKHYLFRYLESAHWKNIYTV